MGRGPVTAARGEKGTWTLGGPREHVADELAQFSLEFLNSLDPLFQHAKDSSECELVCTLLRVRELSAPGMEPFENTRQVFETVGRLVHKLGDLDEARHLGLWLYGHVVEASEPYETFANLLNIIEGNRYLTGNFSDRNGRPISPGEKLNVLENRARALGLGTPFAPLRTLYDREIRNAVFHSDYIIYEGELRLPGVAVRVLSVPELATLIFRAFAYFYAFRSLERYFRELYDEPKVVTMHDGMGHYPNQTALVMVRKGKGAIGIKDNWSPEDLARGEIPFRLGNFLPNEMKMMDADPFRAEFPVPPHEAINRRLRWLPKPLARRIVKRIWNRYE